MESSTASSDTSARSGGAVRFRRVLLKLSGEALMGSASAGVDPAAVRSVAQQVGDLCANGVQVAIVVGAGNFVRGATQAALGMDRATADYMGMVATLLNGLPIQDALEALDIDTRLLSAMDVREVAEPYIRRRAIRHLEKGRVVIFAAGTGNPYFTTDTAAALRALEINADAILMAKNGVDGVFDDDPRINSSAQLLTDLTHADAVARGLQVMDQTALTLCGEHSMDIFVFNMDDPQNIARIARGETLGTVVHTPQEG